MQVHGEDAIRPRRGDKVGNEPRRDGDAGLILLVSATIAVVRHHGGNPPRGGAPRRVHHNEQLHEAGVHRRRDGLHDEHVPLADVLLDADEDILVGELKDFRLA